MMKIRRNTKTGFRTERGPFLSEHIEEGRRVTVTLKSHCLVLRLAGTRQALELPLSTCWFYAAKIKAREVDRARFEARREKSLARKAVRS